VSAANIFKKQGDSFTRYRAVMQVHEQMVGGVPKSKEMIKGWLAARMELDDRALIELTEQTAAEMQGETDERPPIDEVLDKVASDYAQGNGFKQIDGQLVYEGRCMKAALKEAANIAFPGKEFPGKPAGIRKGLMRFMAETVFVDDQYINLGVTAPSRTEERVKHIITAQGPRSAINLVEVIDKPRIECTISVLDDCIKPDVWARVWTVLEHIGLGADRARSDGKFELIEWAKS
jgi:hypothetical protein